MLNLSASCEASVKTSDAHSLQLTRPPSASPKIKYNDRRAWTRTFAATWSCVASPPTSIWRTSALQLVQQVPRIRRIGALAKSSNGSPSWALRSSSCARPLDGDSDQATAALVPSRQQALVLELGDRGIDRSRARVPGSTSAVALACMIW